MFFLHTSTIMVIMLVYVDDIIITGNNFTFLKHLISKLNSTFALKDLGPLSYFLGLEVVQYAHGLHLSQSKYIKDILA